MFGPAHAVGFAVHEKMQTNQHRPAVAEGTARPARPRLDPGSAPFLAGWVVRWLDAITRTLRPRQAASSANTPDHLTIRPPKRSCDNLLDRLGVFVGDADGPADVGVVLLERIDAQRQANRGQEIADRDRPRPRLVPSALVLPNACPPLMPPPASTVLQALG